jgi:hypothetical protein
MNLLKYSTVTGKDFFVTLHTNNSFLPIILEDTLAFNQSIIHVSNLAIKKKLQRNTSRLKLN